MSGWLALVRRVPQTRTEQQEAGQGSLPDFQTEHNHGKALLIGRRGGRWFRRMTEQKQPPPPPQSLMTRCNRSVCSTVDWTFFVHRGFSDHTYALISCPKIPRLFSEPGFKEVFDLPQNPLRPTTPQRPPVSPSLRPSWPGDLMRQSNHRKSRGILKSISR